MQLRVGEFCKRLLPALACCSASTAIVQFVFARIPRRCFVKYDRVFNDPLGGQIACADECLGDLKPSYEAVATTACDKYKIVLPREILSSCKKGFLDAVVKANSVAGKKGSPNLAAEVEARRLQESKAAKAALEKRRLAEEKLKIDKKIKEDAAKVNDRNCILETNTVYCSWNKRVRMRQRHTSVKKKMNCNYCATSLYIFIFAIRCALLLLILVHVYHVPIMSTIFSFHDFASGNSCTTLLKTKGIVNTTT